MCTRNGARFVEAQLRSILVQSVQPVEIVVSDDASSDDTLAVIRSVMLERPDIALVVLDNAVPLGVTKNFERAVSAATGTIIALSDQDDLWHSDRLERALSEFGARPSLALIFGDARLVDADGVSLGHDLFDVLEIGQIELDAIHRGDAFAVLLKRNLVTGATVAFRRSLLDAALPFPSEWVHDEWLAIIAAATTGVDAVEAILIDYRQHGANEIGVQYPGVLRKIRKVLEPRDERNALLAVRSRLLAGRLDALPGVTERSRDLARTKATVEEFRAALPASRFRRIRSVLVADRRGWYADFASQGRRDILRDLLQPHRG